MASTHGLEANWDRSVHQLMNRCETVLTTWKGRRGYCIRNGHVEAVVLPGGGSIVDFRICGSPVNLLWEAPWPTIDPHTFEQDRDAQLYGSAPVGPMLSGCTGHVVAVGYFGMPPEDKPGLPLHGEAGTSLWDVGIASASEDSTELAMNVNLPATGLRLERHIRLRKDASALAMLERLRNMTNKPIAYQWVQHTMFGAPLFAGQHALLSLPAARCITWPLGYEGHAALIDSAEFAWPLAPGIDRNQLNLAHPFVRPESGFVASVLLRHDTESFAAITNTELGLLVGYAFDHNTYPWVALWEENRARVQSPWLGKTQVRGVEFGNSPMPLGLEHAQRLGTLFAVPTFRTLQPFGEAATEYSIFATSITKSQTEVTRVTRGGGALQVHFNADEISHILDSSK